MARAHGTHSVVPTPGNRRLALGIAAVAAAGLVLGCGATEPPTRDAARAGVPSNDQPDGSGGTGTSGTLGGPPASTLGTVITDVRSIGGREDLSEHIGKDVRLVVDIGQAINDVAFWTGDPPDDLLVVIDRGTRDGIERQIGATSGSAFGSPPPGVVTIGGTIEPVPYPEATFSWGLTRRDVNVLAERGVYVRATEVLSSAPDRPGERLSVKEIDEAVDGRP